jgi:hypothetical protein
MLLRLCRHMKQHGPLMADHVTAALFGLHAMLPGSVIVEGFKTATE